MFLRSVTTHVRNQNWLGVVLDFVIVVVGIWLALLISQWSERQQRLTDLARAEVEINEELAISYLNMHERIAIAPCRRERYARLGELLLLPDTQWSGEPLPLGDASISHALPPALRSAFVPFRTDTWDAVLRQGDLDEMPSDRRLSFTSVFEAIKRIDELQNAIQNAESGLQVLSRTVPMTVSDRLRYYDDLAIADGLSSRLESVAEHVIRWIEEEKLVLYTEESRAAAQDEVNEINALFERRHGECAKPLKPALLEETPKS